MLLLSLLILMLNLVLLIIVLMSTHLDAKAGKRWHPAWPQGWSTSSAPLLGLKVLLSHPVKAVRDFLIVLIEDCLHLKVPLNASVFFEP